MKVKNTIKKVGAVAGSALMVGMTMGAAQSLSDFPQPFVDDDGTVQSQVVVGSQGNQADVVGAINVAAALGQNAVQTETRDVPVGGGGQYGWSASSGETLDTRNDQLYFGDDLNSVRETLTSQHLPALEDVTFTDDDGDDYDIEYYLYPDNQEIQFGNSPDGLDDEDPVLYVSNPSDVDNTDHLFEVRANFGDSINFTDDVVQGEDIELFGTEYEVSEDSDESELVLFGSTQTLSLSTDGTTSGTIEVNDEDYSIEIDGVNDGGVIYRVDGDSFVQDEEGDTFTIDGETVRIDNVINRVDDAGSADFKVGSEELHMEDGAAIEDADGDDVEGTYVTFSGTDGDGDGGIVDELSALNLFVGAEDDDQDYVMAGESYTHDWFGNVEFHFGGLNPDAAEGIGEVEVSPSGDDDVVLSFTSDGGDDASINVGHVETYDGTDDNDVELEDDSENPIHVVEGVAVDDGEYFFTEAGDFAHLWEVTDIEVEDTGDGAADIEDTDEATVQITDVVTDQDVEIDLDGVDADGEYQSEEVIDGQTVHFSVNAPGDEVRATWGTGAEFYQNGGNADYEGDEISTYSALDTDTRASVALTDTTTDVSHDLSGGVNVTYELPSTQSTDEQTLTVQRQSGGVLDFEVNGDSVGTATGNGPNAFARVQVGGVVYAVEYDDTGTSEEVTSIDLHDDQSATSFDATAGSQVDQPAVVAIESEDDSDNEHAYVAQMGEDEGDEEVVIDTFDYSGETNGAAGHNPVDLESNDDLSAAYSTFGSYSEVDADGQGMFTVNIPDGQAAAGAAFTSQGGSLDAGGTTGGTSGDTYEAVVDQGTIPNMARLDTQVTSSIRSNNHLVLVGGPAVNQLVADLASDGETWTQQEWQDEHDNEALLQVVQDAFAQDRHALIVAGHSAEDTTAAAQYISNYADHAQALEDAGNQLTLTEADYPSTN